MRWSVFLLGPSGCGKSAIWKTLLRAQNNFGEKTIFRPINPKSVTRNELYGFLHPTTREWKEGLVSVTFRDMANNHVNKHQWIVLDGDIDAEWIESMNTVSTFACPSQDDHGCEHTSYVILSQQRSNHRRKLGVGLANLSKYKVLFLNE